MRTHAAPVPVAPSGRWPCDAAKAGRALAHCRTGTWDPYAVALSALPEEWWPRTPGDGSVLFTLADAASDLAEHVGSYDFLEGGHPDWTAYMDRCGGTRAADAVAGIVDMIRAFERQVVLPFLNRVGLTATGDTFYHRQTLAACVAARVLLGDKRLPAVLELSDRWHAVQDDIDEAVTAGRHDLSWPAPFPPVACPGGVTAVPVTSLSGLRAEGSRQARDGAMGMGHCVATRAPACAAGESCVVSFRRVAPGGFVRLSTMAFRPRGNDLGVTEHRGWRNGEPPPESRAAAEWLAAAFREGTVAVSPGWRHAEWRRPTGDDEIPYDWRDDTLFAAAARAWTPLLRRPLRDPDVLAGSILRETGTVVRTRLPGGARSLAAGFVLPATVPSWMPGKDGIPASDGYVARLAAWPFGLTGEVADAVAAGRRAPGARLAGKAAGIAAVSLGTIAGFPAAVAVAGSPASTTMGVALVVTAFAATSWSSLAACRIALRALGRRRWSGIVAGDGTEADRTTLGREKRGLDAL